MIKKIWHIIQLTLQMLIVVAVGFGISLGISISVMESQRFPSDGEIKSLDNISSHLDQKEKRAVLTSRRSIVQVFSASNTGVAKMSGTYVTYNGKFYVLTAAHGIAGSCMHTRIVADKEEGYDCIQFILIDSRVDYAIVQVPEIPERTPVVLPAAMPTAREWRQELAVLTETFYTGYPNGLGPLTFRGAIAGTSPDKYIYLHSYAWPGSSGSGVFTYDGHMIGILIALNVGFTGAGYDVLEDLVIVTPLFMIDWDTAYEIMQAPDPSGDTGDTGE